MIYVIHRSSRAYHGFMRAQAGVKTPCVILGVPYYNYSIMYPETLLIPIHWLNPHLEQPQMQCSSEAFDCAAAVCPPSRPPKHPAYCYIKPKHLMLESFVRMYKTHFQKHHKIPEKPTKPPVRPSFAISRSPDKPLCKTPLWYPQGPKLPLNPEPDTPKPERSLPTQNTPFLCPELRSEGGGGASRIPHPGAPNRAPM